MTSPTAAALVDQILPTLYTEYASTGRSRALPLSRVLAYPPHAKRQIIDQLLCIRDPVSFGPLDDAVVEDMEALLRLEAVTRAHETIGLDDIPSYSLPSASASSVSFIRGDLTRLTGRVAIVNPANTRMLGCFQPTHKCLDNVIHTAAGPRLRNECFAEMAARGRSELETGEPMLTGSGELGCERVVHVAGPALARGAEPTPTEREELRMSYTASLDLVAEAGLRAIAFPCISTGVFAFPSPLAAKIALSAVRDWLAAHPDVSMRVIFVLWTSTDERDYTVAAAQIVPDIEVEVYVPPLNLPPQVREWVRDADSIIIHAGAGLSADAVRPDLSLGLDYTSTELFAALYPGLVKRTPLRRLYDTIGHEWNDRLTQWGFIFAHAHTTATWGPTAVYADLLALAASKTWYTVKTSNADGLFVQNGFDPARVFTPQGGYGRFQCLTPCGPDSYFDSPAHVDAAIAHLDLRDPRVPEDMAHLIPKCEKCGGEVFLNVRGGEWFLETPHQDAGERYDAAVDRMLLDAQTSGGTVLLLELGAGFNTPSVIRYPSEDLAGNPAVRFVRVNAGYPDVAGHGVGVRAGSAAFLRALQ